jgi:hypothetical protein
LTPGQIAAESARTCVDILQRTAPAARILVWNDMFDPHHNARDRYYLVNGPLTNSWEGLRKEVIIMNWNGDKAAESLGFFAKRGHRQVIACYYDAPVSRSRDWLRRAKDAKVQGLLGVMYTTWRNNYDDLEAFAKMVDEEQVGLH